MIVIKRENEELLRRYGFHRVGGTADRYRYWVAGGELCIKVNPYAILGSLNDVSVISFVPQLNIDLEADDVDLKIEKLQHSYELYYSTSFMSLIDRLLTDGVAEHVDAITDCVKKVSA